MHVGKIVSREMLSPILATLRVVPESGGVFPDYLAGQYIALRRESCRLTRLAVGPLGERRYVPDVESTGATKLGPVTHPYSIASAPSEMRRAGHLEFYVILERDASGTPGRLSSSLFEMQLGEDDELLYGDRAAGSFTLEKRAAGFTHVLLVASGTGLAPLVSMIREQHLRAGRGAGSDVRYTLVHTNRTREELGFHQELLEIEAAQRFDFMYVPTVSRPTEPDAGDARLGRGRANNVLRLVFDMPTHEEESIQEARSRGENAAFGHLVTPALPPRHSKAVLEQRLDPARTVLLTCGNPGLMSDIERIAARRGIRFEKETW